MYREYSSESVKRLLTMAARLQTESTQNLNKMYIFKRVTSVFLLFVTFLSIKFWGSPDLLYYTMLGDVKDCKDKLKCILQGLRCCLYCLDKERILKIAMTVLMHSWYYEKKDLKRTPSIVDGIDIERENRYRREGARFIINVGTKMGLYAMTPMATGVVYFHRFYMFHSFKTFPRYVTACCCLFLAGKVEETPKKCKDIIRIAKTFLAEPQFAQFGDDPKEEVMTLERILLQTIKFDLQVDHPYGHLLKYAKSLKGDKTKLQSMVQMAWTFINDSLCTTLCLQWEPEVIAIALMYLAGKLSKFEVVDWNGRMPKHKHWWDMFVEGMSIELLEDICHQVLDLYSMPIPKSPQASPPATPPTKSTRKTSQPPSPVETTTSPAQIKPKDPPVGQPIPRLEPGELKRKTSQTDNKDSVPDVVKIPRITEGKAIPTISSHSPKKGPSSLGSDTQPSSPSSPIEDTVKTVKDVSRITSDPVYKSGLASSNPPSFAPNPPFIHTDSTAPKLNQHVPQVSASSFSVTVPPPSTTYSQSTPQFFSENQSFPNIQQPPPQIFPQRPPVSFQHPPPGPPTTHPPPPPGLHPPSLPHQYPPGLPPSGMPPFNSQFPPPRHPPPSLLGNPPPHPVPGMTQHHHHPPTSLPQGAPPMPNLIRNVPPPPGVLTPPGVRHMAPDNMYRCSSDMYSSDQRNRPPKDKMTQNPVNRPHFEGNFRGRRDSDFDAPFPRDTSYRRPPAPNKFNQDFIRPPHPNRRFPMDHQKQERGPHPSRNSNQQQTGPTGIPPVRITGRY